MIELIFNSWLMYVPAFIGIYIFTGMIFGCPNRMYPDLAWPVTILVGVAVPIFWKYDLWPEAWKEYCDYCGEVLPPTERRISKHIPEKGDFVVCNRDCSKNLDKEVKA